VADDTSGILKHRASMSALHLFATVEAFIYFYAKAVRGHAPYILKRILGFQPVKEPTYSMKNRY
jgi:hypothetical protein